MRDAETALSIIRERATRGLPLKDVYRLLYNPSLYVLAYGRISQNQGALTRGVTDETVDGMSLEKIDRIIAQMRREAYRWTPARRTYIPKAHGGKRPLGIPTWSDKLVQEVVRLILEAHYEPRFRVSSHGFRPNRGCHTALEDITHWAGTKWFIEGDIKGCFDNIDHTVLLSILAETIHDNRFLRLIRHMLQAGYLEQWVYHTTFSGTPQGGVVSPILANVYLDKLDQFVEQTLIPAHTQGQRRRGNPPYGDIMRRRQVARAKGDHAEVRRLTHQMRGLPAGDPYDPHFRRLHYVRYADDFLLAFIGPKAEAEAMKHDLGTFLRETLKLELSQEKTLITHATSTPARFLGYEVVVQHRDDYLGHHARVVNGKVALRVPAEVIDAYCRRYIAHGRPKPDYSLLSATDFTIVAQYGAIFRGIVNYYCLAHNVSWLQRLRYVMETALLHTLAAKHKSTIQKTATRLKTWVDTPDGPRVCFEVRIPRDKKPPLVARFGGFALKRQRQAVLHDRAPYLGPRTERNERVRRLLQQTCELCGTHGPVVGHHVRKLADLKQRGRTPPPPWVLLMAARRRKTLYVCASCHTAIHAGRLQAGKPTE